MATRVLSSLAEAQAAYLKHLGEQKRAGRRKEPDAWLGGLSKDRLLIVVHGNDSHGPVTKPYEYELDFACEGVHEIITEPARPKETLEKPLRQLHLFGRRL